MPNKWDEINARNALQRRVAGQSVPDSRTLTGAMIGAPEPQIPEGAIIPGDDGSLVCGRCVMTATEMQIPDDIQPIEWENVGKVIKNMNDASSWWVGDHADYANKRWSFTYAVIAEKFGYAATTVEVYASICRSVHGLIRNQAVSISHCGKISALKEPLQKCWIEYAATRNPKLTVAKFAEDIACISQFPFENQMEWFQWAQNNPDKRIADHEAFNDVRWEPPENWKTWKQSGGRLEKALKGDLKLSQEQFEDELQKFVNQARIMWARRKGE